MNATHPLKTALEQFHRGELPFELLQQHVEHFRRTDGASADQALGLIESDFQAGRLPPQVYFALKDRLQGTTAPGHAVASDDATVAHRPPKVEVEVEADDATAIAVSPPPEPADRTYVMSPAPAAPAPQTTASTGTPVSPPTELKGPITLATLTSQLQSAGVETRELQVGDKLKDRFLLQELLGAGGMGQVFKALDQRKVEASDRDSHVALKVLNPDFRDNPQSLIALQREAKRAQTLSHPNIITVYDFDRDGAHVFMSMEYLQGRPLNQLIRELPEGGLPFRQAWPIIQDMGAALAYAHKKNIVHSDFKPGNVFVDQEGNVKVLDFGIACAAGRHDKGGEDATVFNARLLGALTPAYASLEMLQDAEPDPRDDIYALACVTYELLSGKHPYGKLSAQKALELNIQPQPIPRLSRRRWRELLRALALKRENRTPSVDEFLKGLQPRSSLFYSAWAAAIIGVVLTGGNVYLNLTQPAKELPKVTITLTAEQKQKVRDLLELADIHFDVGYLVAPTGSNALWAYQEVLKLDPYNEQAVKGVKKIADAMEQAAWDYYEKGNRAESLKKVMEGLEADPQHEGLLKLKTKLQS